SRNWSESLHKGKKKKKRKEKKMQVQFMRNFIPIESASLSVPFCPLLLISTEVSSFSPVVLFLFLFFLQKASVKDTSLDSATAAYTLCNTKVILH
ncbi:hypothetical protein DKP78_15255, partial [Enterococcus faecium]